MKKTLLASLLLWQFSSASAVDLLQAYRDASAFDAQLAVARASVAAGREKGVQGQALLLPTVAFTGDLSQVMRNPDPGGSASGLTSSLAVTASQPLYRRQVSLTALQADIQVAQAELQYSLAQQDLIVRLSQAYFDVLNAQEALLAVQAQKLAIAQQLELAKKTFEVGTSTITDTHEAQARYDLSLAQEIAVESDLEVKKRALETLTGKETGSLAVLRVDAQISRPEPQDIKRWISDAEKNGLAVRLQQSNTELAEREAEKAAAAHQPTLDLVARLARSSDNASTPNSSLQSINIGLQLNVPLYQGGAINSKEREAAAQRDAARSALENARRVASLQARQAYLGVSNGLSQVKALEAALVSSTSALDATKVGYEVGVRINNDVLNAEQQLSATRRDLAKARFDTLLAQVKLSAAVGALGEDDLQKINAMLQH